MIINKKILCYSIKHDIRQISFHRYFLEENDITLNNQYVMAAVISHNFQFKGIQVSKDDFTDFYLNLLFYNLNVKDNL